MGRPWVEEGARGSTGPAALKPLVLVEASRERVKLAGKACPAMYSTDVGPP